VAGPSAVSVDDGEAIREMVQIIVRRFNPSRVILFGSRARGDARPDSDVDLLEVMPAVDDRRALAIAIRRALAGSALPKDVIVTTPQEIADRGDLVGTTLQAALREGVVVYGAP
jgi:uncharacterized protein